MMFNDPVLITGAAGFIGSHLSDALLADGLRVIGVDNFCDFYDRPRKESNLAGARKHAAFQLIEADIRERDAVMAAFAEHKPKTVVHLAAMAGVRPSIERPDYYAAVNLDGTVNMLDAAVAHGCEKFVFASSSSVYGNNEQVPFAETDNVDHPISPYAATKKAGELICHTYTHIHGLPTACLRFFTVFGPRQRPDLAINKFLRIVSAGDELPMFGDGSTSRDYTFVADIVAGIRAAMERIGLSNKSDGHVVTHREQDDGESFRYRVWNLGGSSPVSLREMIETIEQVVGKKANIKQLPMQPGDVNRTWADLDRSKREIGYEPMTSLKDGVAKQWEWMRGHT